MLCRHLWIYQHRKPQLTHREPWSLVGHDSFLIGLWKGGFWHWTSKMFLFLFFAVDILKWWNLCFRSRTSTESHETGGSFDLCKCIVETRCCDVVKHEVLTRLFSLVSSFKILVRSIMRFDFYEIQKSSSSLPYRQSTPTTSLTKNVLVDQTSLPSQQIHPQTYLPKHCD